MQRVWALRVIDWCRELGSCGLGKRRSPLWYLIVPVWCNSHMPTPFLLPVCRDHTPATGKQGAEKWSDSAKATKLGTSEAGCKALSFKQRATAFSTTVFPGVVLRHQYLRQPCRSSVSSWDLPEQNPLGETVMGGLPKCIKTTPWYYLEYIKVPVLKRVLWMEDTLRIRVLNFKLKESPTLNAVVG